MEGGVIPSRLVDQNQQTCSVVCLVSTQMCAAVRGVAVWLCSLILAFPLSGAVRCGSVSYIGVSTTKVGQGPEIKALSLPIYTLLRWVNKPSDRVAKTWSYTRRYSETTNILFGTTRSLISSQHKQRGGLTP